jgi:2-polyprenyl-3-methyl-5-hydroxy-6-metoxy-1,4-benzoquinol methylase
MIAHRDSQAPAQFLVDNIELLPRGKTLDIAMGWGRNSIYLARSGFSVTGIDISQEAVVNAIKAAREAGVTINAQVIDIERDSFISKEDYDVIICFNFLQRSIIQQIKDGLRLGGMVVYETFIIDQAQFGKPKKPDYLLQYNELLKMFLDFRCLRYREGIIDNRRAIASIVAEKVLPQ